MNVDRVLLHIALLGGIGNVPLAGGTVATLLVGVPVAMILARLHSVFSLAALSLICILGTLGADRAIRHFGREDPGQVVVDELAGYLLTMLWLPATWVSLAAGFLLFRLFDIWKPWPIRWADRRVRGGWGVMLDDLMAGLMAQLLLRFLPLLTG